MGYAHEFSPWACPLVKPADHPHLSDWIKWWVSDQKSDKMVIIQTISSDFITMIKLDKMPPPTPGPGAQGPWVENESHASLLSKIIRFLHLLNQSGKMVETDSISN